MFSGNDDDLGVFDDDFLCEVFHPAGHQGFGEEKQESNSLPAHLQCPQVTSQQPEHTNEDQSHPSIGLTNHVQDQQAKGESEGETHLIPDDFFSDFGDLEDDLTTPPDSAFTQENTKSALCQGDFRLRILKVIKTQGDEVSSRLSARKRKEEEKKERDIEEEKRCHIAQSHSPAVTPRSSGAPHKRKTEASAHRQLIQKRKFPGPAGLLSQTGQKRSEVSTEATSGMTLSDSQVIVSSQSSASDFTSGPWQQMLHDLALDPSNAMGPLGVFNVRWITCRAGLRGGAGVKRVPFLAAKVKSVDALHSHPTVTLCDPTGEIKGTVSAPVLQDFGHALTPGAVLVLRGVTVLSPGVVREARLPRPRRHYLNITRSTVLTIYTPDEAGNITTTNVEDFDCRDLQHELDSPTTSVCGPCAIIEEEEEDQKDSAKAGRVPQHSNNAGNSVISGSLFSRVGGIAGGDGPRLASPSILGRGSGMPQGRGVSTGMPQGRGESGGPSRVSRGVGSARLQGMNRGPPPLTHSHQSSPSYPPPAPHPPAPHPSLPLPAPPFCPPLPPPPLTVPHRPKSQTHRPPQSPQTIRPASLHTQPHINRPASLHTQPLPNRPTSQHTQPLPNRPASQHTQPHSNRLASLPTELHPNKPAPHACNTPSTPLNHPHQPSHSLNPSLLPPPPPSHASTMYPPQPPQAHSSSLNRSIFSSQAEEEEVKELLDSLDEDSIFGDF